FPLPRHVAAIALREDVLPSSLDGLPRDHARPDRSLYRHIDHLTRDLLSQAIDERAPAAVGAVAVDDEAECVDRVAGEEDVDAGEASLFVDDDDVVAAA